MLTALLTFSLLKKSGALLADKCEAVIHMPFQFVGLSVKTSRWQVILSGADGGVNSSGTNHQFGINQGETTNTLTERMRHKNSEIP